MTSMTGAARKVSEINEPENIPPASPEPVNHAPVVTVPSPTVQTTGGETSQVSDLFSATDANNDTLTFLLNDTTAVTVPSQTVQATAGETLHLGDLIATQGGDALAYLLYDATPGGGHFAVDGVDVDQIVTVTPAQLAQTTFVPAIGGSDDLLVGAINEHGFGGWAGLHII